MGPISSMRYPERWNERTCDSLSVFSLGSFTLDYISAVLNSNFINLQRNMYAFIRNKKLLSGQTINPDTAFKLGTSAHFELVTAPDKLAGGLTSVSARAYWSSTRSTWTLNMVNEFYRMPQGGGRVMNWKLCKTGFSTVTCPSVYKNLEHHYCVHETKRS